MSFCLTVIKAGLERLVIEMLLDSKTKISALITYGCVPVLGSRYRDVLSVKLVSESVSESVSEGNVDLHSCYASKK